MSFIEVTNVFYKKAALVPEIGLYCKTNPKVLTDTGLGAIDIRARQSYREWYPNHYPTHELICIASIKMGANKDSIPVDGSSNLSARQ